MRSFFDEFFDNEQLYIRGEISASSLEIIQPHLMPDNIKSALIWLIPYYTGKHENRNVSLYAVSRDYHIYARSLNKRLCEMAKEQFPDEEFYGFCDSSPINEVAAAITAGLGVLGKNRLLINETYGSFVFIGSLLSTLVPEKASCSPLKRCSGCGRCERACEFLSGRSTVCLSELNQKKQLTEDELLTVKAQKIRWGCDRCQEVCPMNKDISITPLEFFHKDIIESVTADMIEKMPKSEFKQRAYSWRGKTTILRNFTDTDS